MSGDDPKTIWLEPSCNECFHRDTSDTGRLWCEDNVFEKCNQCGRKPVRYIRDDRSSRSIKNGENK